MFSSQQFRFLKDKRSLLKLAIPKAAVAYGAESEDKS
jgi:hypothetical protein